MNDLTDRTLSELVAYAAANMLTAPPGFCAVSADTLYDLVTELQRRRRHLTEPPDYPPPYA